MEQNNDQLNKQDLNSSDIEIVDNQNESIEENNTPFEVINEAQNVQPSSTATSVEISPQFEENNTPVEVINEAQNVQPSSTAASVEISPQFEESNTPVEINNVQNVEEPQVINSNENLVEAISPVVQQFEEQSVEPVQTDVQNVQETQSENVDSQSNYVEKPVNNKLKKGLIIAGVVIMLIGCGFVAFSKFMNSSNKSNETPVVEVKEKDLDINSDLVQKLFKTVNYDSIHMKWKRKKGVSAEEMLYQDKFALAVRNVETTKVNCSDIKKEINGILGTDYDHRCGEDVFSSISFDKSTLEWNDIYGFVGYADLYKEDDVKSAMYNIFGKDYYERKYSIDDNTFDYVFITSKSGYIKVHEQRGIERELFNEKLVSAKEKDGEITIISKDQSERHIYLIYSFKLNKNDNNYYFDNLVIEK